VVIETRREEAEEAARLAAPEPVPASDDVVGGDVFSSVFSDTQESRDE